MVERADLTAEPVFDRSGIYQGCILLLGNEGARVRIGDQRGAGRARADRGNADHIGLGYLGRRHRPPEAELADHRLLHRRAGNKLQVGLHLYRRDHCRGEAEASAPRRLHQDLRRGRVLLSLL